MSEFAIIKWIISNNKIISQIAQLNQQVDDHSGILISI